MPVVLPPLPALRQFEAAARYESFVRAAQELGQTASAVSHGISSLEKWLGAPLFQRTVRGVRLTSAGTQFLPYVVDGLTTIALGADRLPGPRMEKRVTLSAPTAFAQHFLIPRLADFRKRYPAIRLSIDTTPRRMLVPLDGFDLLVSTGAQDAQTARVELLFGEQLLPVVAGDYLSRFMRHGVFDWSSATLLRSSSAREEWNVWTGSSGVELSAKDELYFDAEGLSWEAAAAGLGVAMGRLPLIRSDLVCGRLVAVAEPAVKAESGYWLVGAQGSESRAAVTSFRNWLLEETSDYRGPMDWPQSGSTGLRSVSM
jgi:LysR family glycine cleavage system transcriptional activator